MTILKSIGLIFLYERPSCLSGMCSNDDDDMMMTYYRAEIFANYMPLSNTEYLPKASHRHNCNTRTVHCNLCCTMDYANIIY